MNRIAQYTAVFTLLLYKYVFYSSHSIVEIQFLLYRYFYRYFVGILPETRYFLLAFYRYFRETLDSVIFLRPRWQPCKEILSSFVSAATQDGSPIDKPARLIIRLLFGFASDSLFVKLNNNINK